MPFDKKAKTPLSEIIGTEVSGDSAQFLVIGEKVLEPGQYTFSYFSDFEWLADVLPRVIDQLPVVVRHKIATTLLESLLVQAQKAEDEEPARIVTLDS